MLFNCDAKTIDQKKRAVITRPFGREASIVMEKTGKNQALSVGFAVC